MKTKTKFNLRPKKFYYSWPRGDQVQNFLSKGGRDEVIRTLEGRCRSDGLVCETYLNFSLKYTTKYFFLCISGEPLFIYL